MSQLMFFFPFCLFLSIVNIPARLEKSISEKIINYEKNIENEVCKNLNMVHEQHILGIQKQKSIVRKCVQDSASARQKYEVFYYSCYFLIAILYIELCLCIYVNIGMKQY